MSLINTINFLPAAFRSATNQRFLGATLDQLFTSAVDIPINGYIGRKFAPTFKVTDNYIPEIDKDRKNYQLEPGVVVKNSNNEITFNSDYIDLLRSIQNKNGLTNNHQRLFGQESYTFDGHFDYDKFVNYYKYYWLPNGPASVDIYANQVPLQETYTITKNTDVNGYTFSGIGNHPNLQLTLARGGTYKFQVNQPGSRFWIQSQPGISGTDPNVPTISTREVYGVANNGAEQGEITFHVPLPTAQNFYLQMQTKSTVSAAVTIHYNQIQGRLLSEFLADFPDGLDGLNTGLNDKTIIFINNDRDDSYWTVDSSTVADTQRPGVWKIQLNATEDADYRIELIPGQEIIAKEKVSISSGKTYASNQFWLDDTLRYKIVPPITATTEYLYYQDGSDSNFYGVIKLVDNVGSTIDVTNDILGKPGYTNPNATNHVKFTNGLKVKFDNSVTPSSYANNEYYVDGVGSAITLTPVSETEVYESYGANIDTDPDYITINRGSLDRNPWSRYNRWFHVDVINDTAMYNNTTADFGPNIPARRPIIEFDAGVKLFNFGVQAKAPIDLIVFSNPVANIVEGGNYTILTIGTTDFTALGADNNTIGTTFVATRDGTGSDGTGTTTTDAFNQVEGRITATVDGVTLQNGNRVVFANDVDTNTINKIYVISIETINSVHYINLVESSDDPILPGEQLSVRSGNSNAKKTFRFDGSAWTQCQVKTGINQAPLFDIVDSDGYSFSDATVYPGSTFVGTKFFGYSAGTGTNDTVLGFALKYQTFNNVGDIAFSNYYDTDTFSYTSSQATVTKSINTGYLTKHNGLASSVSVNNWIKTVEDSKQYQLFTKFYDGYVVTLNGVEKAFVQIDVLPPAQQSIPYLKVYLNNVLLTRDVDYSLIPYGIYYIVVLTTLPTVGDKIDVAVFSTEPSADGYYEIPSNLDFNPLNENFSTVTLGQLRNHYYKLIENTSALLNNSVPVQDLYIRAQGGTLLQHSSPLIYAMSFLNNPDINFVNGVTLAKKEYAKFRNKFLSLCSSLDTIDYNNPITGVDLILKNINAVKTSSFAWYYSDMVPQGDNHTDITYTVLNVRQKNYEIGSIFDITQLSNRAVLVWHQRGTTITQLTHGTDYTFSTVAPSIQFIRTFEIDDQIIIRDYSNTDGNFIPETPTKLGLYPKFAPEKYLDDTYSTPQQVIRGHDGSITPAFNDFRDDYILELEKRIYNNIKANYDQNTIDLYDVRPGRFRDTDYSHTEFTQVLSESFLAWTGLNNLDYSTNTTYDANNPWTWNYSVFPDRIDGSLLQGSWRAVYQYWFDTDTPNLTPWVMLGFGDKPTWWETRYGAAPYTNGNAVLWEDLEAGYIWNNGSSYTDSRFARPGLTSFIPVDSAGNLLSPTDIPLISKFNSTQAGSKFAAGHLGPVEVAWTRSSDYPFAIQTALALLKPAKYFSTQLDISKFYKNPYTGQQSTIDNKKISPSIVDINGYSISYIDDNLNYVTLPTQRTAGYINWIADSIKNLGMDPGLTIGNFLSNMSVQLGYKVGGFTDKNLITTYAEQATPGSSNASIIVPDANYNVYLNKSIPTKIIEYSAVVVEKTATGYSVSGYNIDTPFFNIYPSIIDNKNDVVKINEVAAKIYSSASKTVQVIPYGTEFSTVQQTVDFLISYERYLISQGFDFSEFDTDLQQQKNWTLSVKELLYWSQQGWPAGTIIVLNPVASRIVLNSSGSIVDEITNHQNGSKLLDQNFLPIKHNNFNIVRTENVTGNSFRIAAIDQSLICFARLELIQFEHNLIFDNVSEFGDIFYVPTLGTRQYRLKVAGVKAGAWTGALSAAGYVYNPSAVDEWITGKDYKTGDIVTHNNLYFTAVKDVAASTQFDPVVWAHINKKDIKTGLLPSFGHTAQQFVNIYDVDRPPTNETIQSYSAGLIGFRQRSYLTDLGISIPTQTKFYQGYIKEKGSINSINALTNANFNNVSGNISINEEWAFRVGAYGGLDTNTFKEFVIDQSVFTTNPVAFVSANTYSAGNIVVNLNGNATANGNAALGLLSNVYNSSNLSSSSTTLYDNRVDTVHMTDLPSVGYVNVDDVDYQFFTLDSVTASLEYLGAGDKIWVAKDAAGNWDILRTNATNLVASSITYTLDSYGQLKFDTAHPFQVGSAFVLKYFDAELDGIYNVVSVPNSTSVVIKVTNTSALRRLIRGLSITGTGIAYSLSSARISTVHDIGNKLPSNGWTENDKVWVDSATTNGWGVYNYNTPWNSNNATKITANAVTANDRFGSAVRVSSDNKYLYVGNPGAKQVQVFANVGGQFVSNVTLSNVNTSFGSVIESQGNLLIVASPSTANIHIYRHWANATVTKIQTITSANTVGINSVSLSSDQTRLYVGDAVNNIVETYYTPNAGWANASYAWATAISGTASTQFGNVVRTNSDGSTLFVSAPYATNGYTNNGNVYVYTRSGNALSLLDTVSSQSKNENALFGYSLDIDSASGNLYVGIPGSTESGQSNGAVERFVFSGGHYVYNQTLTQPTMDIGRFGVSISVSSDAAVLAIGSEGSSTDEHTYFDEFTTIIDSDTTKFIDHILNSGVTYIFENQINQSTGTDTGKYSFVQELEAQLISGDLFGTAVDVTRSVIAVGAPGKQSKSGAAYTFVNPAQSPAWQLIREQQPKVDINSISRTFIYNKTNNNLLAALDYIDPLKGKVLNSVDRDIDIKTTVDPAVYNAGTGMINSELHWGANQVGKIWWNLDTIRYIDYEQDAAIYRLNHWGERFPGSEVLVYEWIESTTLPSQYTGSGTPLHMDDSAYSTHGYVDQTGNVKLKYYFWVTNRDVVNTRAGKNNSVVSIAAAIENPQSQGIPYATVLKDNAIALHNVTQFITGKNSVLHLGTQTSSDALIHSEYALIQESATGGQLPTTIVNKLIDSLSGIDKVGNTVPDPTLAVSQRYGISIRPRQTMVLNRTAALYEIFTTINQYLAQYPVTARKPLTLLNSEESIPSIDSGEYDLTVSTKDELGYVNTADISAGYRVLVSVDSTQSNKWAIYQWSGTAWAIAVRDDGTNWVQSYKTNLYWSYADWYDTTFDPTLTINTTVANNLDLGKLTLVPDTYIKVKDDGNGKFLIYYVDSSTALNLVGIESGTVQLGTASTIPSKDVRQLLLAIRQEIFTDDIAGYFNNIFFTMMRYILSEQKNIDWLFKTSFVSATQHIRKLEQLPTYVSDNQNFYLDYINEVKPYRTVIREFIVNYERNDVFGGDITDFDLPSYWDTNLSVYRSPNGEQTYDADLLKTGLYNPWYTNHKYGVVDVLIETGGTGYIIAPQIIITGGGGTGAAGYAEILDGQVTEIVITEPGSGYTSTPAIVINGTGSGATARAVLRNVFDNNNTGHNVVRSIKTNIKFDRISYTTSNTFVMWDTVSNAQVISANTVIFYNDTLYRLDANNYTVTANIEFPLADVTVINARDFDTANDRITAFNGNVDLSLYVDGISYPGVILDGNNATVWTANLSIEPDRLITYQGAVYITQGNVFDAGGTFANILANVTETTVDSLKNVGIDTDSVIQSLYTDNLGINPSDINIDGGAYVDEYSSHAPQELVPGQMFDSLNLQVFDSNLITSTNNYAFRLFDNMTQDHSFYRISDESSTTLYGNLSITDQYISVANAAVLPAPNSVLGIPGIVFVNNEKISYYKNYAYSTAWTANTSVPNDSVVTYNSNIYVTTGNVYAPYFANIASNVSLVGNISTFGNSLGRIRRAVDGTAAFNPSVTVWTANTDIDAGTVVYYQGNIGTVSGNVYGNAFANAAPGITANITPVRVVDASIIQSVPNVTVTTANITSATTYTTTANVSLVLRFSSNVTANVGEYIVQKFANTTVAANLRVIGNVKLGNAVPAVKIGGNLTALTGNTITINGNITANTYVSNSVLGTVNANGNVVVSATASDYVLLKQTNAWYTSGAGTATDGTGLINSTTQQAVFLLDKPGYMP